MAVKNRPRTLAVVVVISVIKTPSDSLTHQRKPVAATMIRIDPNHIAIRENKQNITHFLRL